MDEGLEKELEGNKVYQRFKALGRNKTETATDAEPEKKRKKRGE